MKIWTAVVISMLFDHLALPCLVYYFIMDGMA